MKIDKHLAHAQQLTLSGLPTPDGKPLPGSPQHIDATARNQKERTLLRTARTPYLGSTLIPVAHSDASPKQLDAELPFNYGTARVSLATVAARISKLAGLPVRIRPDVYQTAASSPVAAGGRSSPATVVPPPLPPLGTTAAHPPAPPNAAVSLPSRAGGSASPPEVIQLTLPSAAGAAAGYSEAVTLESVPMQWNATLRGYLDYITGLLSLSWEYKDGAVVISRIVTQTYSIATIPGQQRYGMSSGGSGSGSGSGGGQNSSANLQASAQDGFKQLLAQSGGPGSSFRRKETGANGWQPMKRDWQMATHHPRCCSACFRRSTATTACSDTRILTA